MFINPKGVSIRNIFLGLFQVIGAEDRAGQALIFFRYKETDNEKNKKQDKTEKDDPVMLAYGQWQVVFPERKQPV